MSGACITALKAAETAGLDQQAPTVAASGTTGPLLPVTPITRTSDDNWRVALMA